MKTCIKIGCCDLTFNSIHRIAILTVYSAQVKYSRKRNAEIDDVTHKLNDPSAIIYIRTKKVDMKGWTQKMWLN
jgi:hypothetical protein